MEISRNLKIGALVISGIAFAFLAGYVIFSYFSRDRAVPSENVQLTNETPVEIESDSEGISSSNGTVAGVSDNDDSDGISATMDTNGTITSQNTNKGGVLGDTTTSTSVEHQGIVPTYGNVQKTTITPEDRAEYKKKESENDADEEVDTSDSEITLYEYPEVDEEDDYTQYTYTFEFNSDAHERYKDGFDYEIDAGSCNDDDFFTSDKYDFSGNISDVDREVEIKVRIKNDYIDDRADFDSGYYKFDGKNYTVEGEVKIPQCED